jgi:hypothetical protein
MQHTYRKLKQHKTAVKNNETSGSSSTRNSEEISQQMINNKKCNACKITLNYSEHKK